MSLRVGVCLLSPERGQRLLNRHAQRSAGLLHDAELRIELSTQQLLVCKLAALRAVGGLGLRDMAGFCVTRVRGGHAAIPRQRAFEARLVEIGVSWVALSFGELAGLTWALAVALPGAVEDFEAVLVLDTVTQVLDDAERLDASSRAVFDRGPRRQLTLAGLGAVARATEQLFAAPFVELGVQRQDAGLVFSAPPLLLEVPLAVTRAGSVICGAVARAAPQRRVVVQTGQSLAASMVPQ